MAVSLALVGISLSVVGSFLPLNQSQPPSKLVNLQAAGETWVAFGVWLILWFFGRAAAAGVAVGILNGRRRQVGGGVIVALGSSLFLHPLASMVSSTLDPDDGPGVGAGVLALGGLLVLFAGISAFRSTVMPRLNDASPSDSHGFGTWGLLAAIAYVAYEVASVVFDEKVAIEDAVFQVEPLALGVLSALALILGRRGSHHLGTASGLLLGVGLAFTLRVPILGLPHLIWPLFGYEPRPLDAIPAIPAAVAGGLLLTAGVRSYREWAQIVSRSTESVASEPG